MRVLFCKIHCPSFICFCKPSTASHLYNSGPLKLENCTQAPSPLVVNDPLDQNHDVVEEIVEVKEKDVLEDGEKESVVESVVLRSCMKNKGDSQRSVIDGKKVQWTEDLGKEFESRCFVWLCFFELLSILLMWILKFDHQK
ncbi:hypothetical protein CTI12_AA226390 [Artemisia annua]|uniref:Uncharacterized protein n=1 Tax=Artemisia annua TaxID=35608 RepID=A0A2U1NUK3_ARTAN|nr:hypothetical protein CTI12_AA226390 [Artemisia annua]